MGLFIVKNALWEGSLFTISGLWCSLIYFYIGGRYVELVAKEVGMLGGWGGIWRAL